MGVFEITIQRQEKDAWPVVVRHQPGTQELAWWSRGRLNLDLEALDPLLPSDKAYGLLLGKALFQEEIRDAFVRAVAESTEEPLRVLLIVEADDLRRLHWEQLCAPLDRGWDYLLLNQQTPFSLYLPSQIERRFPPIGRRDLRALVLVAGPEELDGDYGLDPFDVAATVDSLRQALSQIPCEVLARVEGASGLPRLDVLCQQLTARADSKAYTLLHIVCHGAYHRTTGETLLYFPMDEGLRPVPATDLLEHLGRLGRLPHLTFLSTCESADPRAEAGLGGLGQRLVRDLGMPAVVAMTDSVSIATAQALATSFYARLSEHGEVDRSLGQALAGLQGRADVTVPALFSRLGGRTLWSDALDRLLTAAEVGAGLEQMEVLLDERAPVLEPEFEDLAARLRASLGVDPAALSAEARREREAALATANQLCREALDLSFNALARGQSPPAYDGRCPFPGLLAFGARYLASGQVEHDDREFFFGREALIARLQEKLAEHPFLPVLGPSGSGKSSLVLAGLVPALQKEEPRLQTAYLTPGSHPQAQLEAALAKAAGGEHGPDLVVVDQFEELFTLCADQNERRAFLDRLLALAGEMWVVLTMRADFWGDCAPYPALKAAMQARQELINAMDASELHAAVERQAQKVGLRFEADLSNTMVDAVMGEPGSMPLLQHALLELWKRRHGRWLMAEEYRDGIGGVKKAIAETAEGVYKDERLSDADRDRLRDVMVRLTRLGEEAVHGEERRDTRQRVEQQDLVPAGEDPAATRALVQRLADARLVVTSANPATGSEEVEVAHEALIRHWPRLRQWLDEDRANWRLRKGIDDAAKEWQAHGGDESYLYSGARLAEAEGWAAAHQREMNALEARFLEASVELRDREIRAEEERRQHELEQAHALAEQRRLRTVEQSAALKRLRVLVAALAVALLSAIALTLYSQAQRNMAQLANKRLLVSEAQLYSDQDPRIATLIGLQAAGGLNEREDTLLKKELIGILLHTLSSSKLARFQKHSASIMSGTFDRTGDLVLTSSRDNTAAVWNRLTGAREQSLLGHLDVVPIARFSPDGRTIATASWDNSARLWNRSDGSVRAVLGPHDGDVVDVIFSPQGERVLTLDQQSATVKAWSADSGDFEYALTQTYLILSVMFSPDGQRIATAGRDSVRIWRSSDGSEINVLYPEPPESSPIGMGVLSRGFAVAYDNGDIHAWDWNGAGLGKDTDSKMAGLAEGISHFAVDPGSDLLVAVGRQKIVAMNFRGQATWSRPVEGTVSAIASSNSGSKLAVGTNEGTILVLNLSGDLETTFSSFRQITAMAFSPDDAELLVGYADGMAELWELHVDTSLLTTLGESDTGDQPSIVLHPSGSSFLYRQGDGWKWLGTKDTESEYGGLAGKWTFRTIASRANAALLVSPNQGAGVIWLGSRNEPIPQEAVPWLNKAVLSPDGRYLAWSQGAAIGQFDTATGESTLASQEGTREDISLLAYCPNGSRLVTATGSGGVGIWRVTEKSLEYETKLAVEYGPIAQIVFLQDSRGFAIFAENGKADLWDIDGQSHRSIGWGQSIKLANLGPSGDAILMVPAGDASNPVLWRGGKAANARLQGHHAPVTDIDMTADGSLIVTASQDGTAMLWSGVDGDLMAVFQGHQGAIRSARFSPDAQSVVTVGEDHTLRVHPINLQGLERLACRRLKASLTMDKWPPIVGDPAIFRRTCADYS